MSRGHTIAGTLRDLHCRLNPQELSLLDLPSDDLSLCSLQRQDDDGSTTIIGDEITNSYASFAIAGSVSSTTNSDTEDYTESVTTTTDTNQQLIIIISSVAVSGLCITMSMMVVALVCKMRGKSHPDTGEPQQTSVNRENVKQNGSEYTELNMETLSGKEEYETLKEVPRESGANKNLNYDYAYADLNEGANATEDNDVYEITEQYIDLDSDKQELDVSSKVTYVNCQRPIKAENFVL